VTVGVFSFFVNVLILAMPIYLFQLSDRVYTSRSTDTLVMLSVIVVGAIVAHVLLDMMRRLILTWIAVEAESKFRPPDTSQLPQLKSLGFVRARVRAGADQYLSGFFSPWRCPRWRRPCRSHQ
jgi:ATP-binding cassette subfamily C protein